MSPNKTSRIAGFLYLVVILTGLFGFMYVPNKLIFWSNAALTSLNITKADSLFRLSIFSGIVCYFTFLFLSLVLYRLLRSVNENATKLMVILVLICIPIYLINVQNQLTVLSLLNDQNYVNIFSRSEINSQVLMHLDQYGSGMSIVSLFSGLWLFPFGYLVYKSRFLPKILGFLLILGGVGYIIDFLGFLLYKNYELYGFSRFLIIPASVGEVLICLWLLIAGVKKKIETI